MVVVTVAVLVLAAFVCVRLTLGPVLGGHRPWPHQLRILLTAHHAQSASGLVAMSMWEGTVIDVSSGDGPHWVVLGSPHREWLRLDGVMDGTSLEVLRYWRDEAIPVLLLQGSLDVLEVHGPSGVVSVSLVPETHDTGEARPVHG